MRVIRSPSSGRCHSAVVCRTAMPAAHGPASVFFHGDNGELVIQFDPIQEPISVCVSIWLSPAAHGLPDIPMRAYDFDLTVPAEVDDVTEFILDAAAEVASPNLWPRSDDDLASACTEYRERRLRPLMAGDLVQVITVDGGTFWRKNDDGWEELPDYTPATINGI